MPDNLIEESNFLNCSVQSCFNSVASLKNLKVGVFKHMLLPDVFIQINDQKIVKTFFANWLDSQFCYFIFLVRDYTTGTFKFLYFN